MAAGSVAGAAQAAAPGSAAGRPLGWPDPLYLCVGLLIVGVITLAVGLYGLRRADRAG